MSFSLAGYLSSVDVCLFYRISCWPGSLAARNKMENIWVFRHRSRIFVTDMSRNNHGHQITMNKAFVTMDDDVVTMVFQLFVVIVCQIQGRAEDFFLPVAITFLTTPGKFLTAPPILPGAVRNLPGQ